MKKVLKFVKGKRHNATSTSPRSVSSEFPVETVSNDNIPPGQNTNWVLPKRDISSDNFKILHDAAWRGNLQDLKHALKVCDINATDHLGRTALHLAAVEGHVSCICLLLKNANSNLKDADGMTPFMKAVESGRLDCVKPFLENDANLQVKDKHANTVLHIATQKGYFDIVKVLLQKSLNIIDCANKLGDTCLHIATSSHFTDIASLLLRHGCSVNARDNDKRTPLMLAARLGSPELVNLFIEYKADVRMEDAKGMTAAKYARLNEHLDIFNLLNEICSTKSKPAKATNEYDTISKITENDSDSWNDSIISGTEENAASNVNRIAQINPTVAQNNAAKLVVSSDQVLSKDYESPFKSQLDEQDMSNIYAEIEPEVSDINQEVSISHEFVGQHSNAIYAVVNKKLNKNKEHYYENIQTKQSNENMQSKETNENIQSKESTEIIQSKQLNKGIKPKQLNESIQSKQVNECTKTIDSVTVSKEGEMQTSEHLINDKSYCNPVENVEIALEINSEDLNSLDSITLPQIQQDGKDISITSPGRDEISLRSSVTASPLSAVIPPPCKPLRSLEYLQSEFFGNSNVIDDSKSKRLFTLGTIRSRHTSFTDNSVPIEKYFSLQRRSYHGDSSEELKTDEKTVDSKQSPVSGQGDFGNKSETEKLSFSINEKGDSSEVSLTTENKSKDGKISSSTSESDWGSDKSLPLNNQISSKSSSSKSDASIKSEPRGSMFLKPMKMSGLRKFSLFSTKLYKDSSSLQKIDKKLNHSISMDERNPRIEENDDVKNTIKRTPSKHSRSLSFDQGNSYGVNFGRDESDSKKLSIDDSLQLPLAFKLGKNSSQKDIIKPINENCDLDIDNILTDNRIINAQLESYDDALKHLEKCDLSIIYQKSKSLPRTDNASSPKRLHKGSLSLPRSLTAEDAFKEMKNTYTISQRSLFPWRKDKVSERNLTPQRRIGFMNKIRNVFDKMSHRNLSESSITLLSASKSDNSVDTGKDCKLRNISQSKFAIPKISNEILRDLNEPVLEESSPSSKKTVEVFNLNMDNFINDLNAAIEEIPDSSIESASFVDRLDTGDDCSNKSPSVSHTDSNEEEENEEEASPKMNTIIPKKTSQTDKEIVLNSDTRNIDAVEVEALELSLAEAREALNGHKNLVQLLKSQISEMSIDYHKHIEDTSKLRLSYNLMKMEQSQLKDMSLQNEIKGKISSKDANVGTEENCCIEELLSETENWKQQYALMRSCNDDLNRELANLKNFVKSNESIIDENVDALKEEIKNITDEKQNLREMVEQLQIELNDSQKKQAYLENKIISYDEERSKNEETDNDELKEQYSDLCQCLEQVKSDHSEELYALTKQLRELEKESNLLKLNIDELQSINTQLKNEKTQIDNQIENECSKYKLKIEHLEKDRSSLTKKLESVTEIQKQYREDFDKLKKEKEKLSSINLDFKSTLSEKENEISILKTKLESAEKKYSDMVSENTASEAEVNDLIKTVEDFQRDKETLLKKNEKLELEIATIRNEKLELEERFNNQDDTIRRCSEKIEKVDSEMNSFIEANKNMRTENEKLKQQIAVLSDKLKDKEDSVQEETNNKEELSAIKGAKSVLERELELIKVERNSLRSDIEKLNKKLIAALECSCQNIQPSKINDLTILVEKVKLENIELKKAIEKLKSEVKYQTAKEGGDSSEVSPENSYNSHTALRSGKSIGNASNAQTSSESARSSPIKTESTCNRKNESDVFEESATVETLVNCENKCKKGPSENIKQKRSVNDKDKQTCHCSHKSSVRSRDATMNLKNSNSHKSNSGMQRSSSLKAPLRGSLKTSDTIKNDSSSKTQSIKKRTSKSSPSSSDNSGSPTRHTKTSIPMLKKSKKVSTEKETTIKEKKQKRNSSNKDFIINTCSVNIPKTKTNQECNLASNFFAEPFALSEVDEINCSRNIVQRSLLTCDHDLYACAPAKMSLSCKKFWTPALPNIVESPGFFTQNIVRTPYTINFISKGDKFQTEKSDGSVEKLIEERNYLTKKIFNIDKKLNAHDSFVSVSNEADYTFPSETQFVENKLIIKEFFSDSLQDDVKLNERTPERERWEKNVETMQNLRKELDHIREKMETERHICNQRSDSSVDTNFFISSVESFQKEIVHLQAKIAEENSRRSALEIQLHQVQEQLKLKAEWDQRMKKIQTEEYKNRDQQELNTLREQIQLQFQEDKQRLINELAAVQTVLQEKTEEQKKLKEKYLSLTINVDLKEDEKRQQLLSRALMVSDSPSLKKILLPERNQPLTSTTNLMSDEKLETGKSLSEIYRAQLDQTLQQHRNNLGLDETATESDEYLEEFKNKYCLQ